GVFGYIFSPIASLFSYFSYIFLKIVIEIVTWFASLSFSLVSIPEIPLFWVVLAYLLIGLYIWFEKDKKGL
ncbi:hypothetical protein GW765_01220, partial [Candidatus Parcubacteria bacterium]|nr:hypothetical protein [Candidatus Parcubacteria bacterium]